MLSVSARRYGSRKKNNFQYHRISHCAECRRASTPLPMIADCRRNIYSRGTHRTTRNKVFSLPPVTCEMSQTKSVWGTQGDTTHCPALPLSPTCVPLRGTSVGRPVPTPYSPLPTPYSQLPTPLTSSAASSSPRGKGRCSGSADSRENFCAARDPWAGHRPDAGSLQDHVRRTR